MAQILTVDFKSKELIHSHCIPKLEQWKCDVCTRTFVSTEGSDDNVKRVEFEKDVKTTSGKTSLKVGFRICEHCCNQIGDIFKGE